MNQDVVIDSIKCHRKVNQARSNNRLRGLSSLQPLVDKTYQGVGGGRIFDPAELMGVDMRHHNRVQPQEHKPLQYFAKHTSE